MLALCCCSCLILLTHCMALLFCLQECSAGDSAAYQRRNTSLDDVVIVSALRTPLTKVRKHRVWEQAPISVWWLLVPAAKVSSMHACSPAVHAFITLLAIVPCNHTSCWQQYFPKQPSACRPPSCCPNDSWLQQSLAAAPLIVNKPQPGQYVPHPAHYIHAYEPPCHYRAGPSLVFLLMFPAGQAWRPQGHRCSRPTGHSLQGSAGAEQDQPH
jgi:hypothetical protein